MSLSQLIAPFPWEHYSAKLARAITSPKCAGVFREGDAKERGVRLSIGQDGGIEEGNCVRLYWFVDREDGTIIDSRFQVFGQSALIGAAESACRLLAGKNYDQACRVSADLIDQQMRDKSNTPAFPPETAPHLNLVLGAIDDAASFCTDIPLPSGYIQAPIPEEHLLGKGEPVPGWEQLSLQEQIACIEEVLNREVRPYIALDAGGVEIINLIEGKELIIGYQGSCTSCYASVGTTLSYIQQILRAHIHPELSVTPKMDQLNLG